MCFFVVFGCFFKRLPQWYLECGAYLIYEGQAVVNHRISFIIPIIATTNIIIPPEFKFFLPPTESQAHFWSLKDQMMSNVSSNLPNLLQIKIPRSDPPWTWQNPGTSDGFSDPSDRKHSPPPKQRYTANHKRRSLAYFLNMFLFTVNDCFEGVLKVGPFLQTNICCCLPSVLRCSPILSSFIFGSPLRDSRFMISSHGSLTKCK